ncbi:MAG: hypothetical protein GEU74_00335 [Nitriliruptorales bacterium]|nr:hypothetical protein [Nitriliruptorales bacterium]
MHSDIDWDDLLWYQVWERNLSQLERHAIAMAVLRGRVPADPFEGRVALELARRWRRHAVSLSLLYLLWSLFWSVIGWDAVHRYGGEALGLPLACTILGAAAVAACLLFRRRLRAILRLDEFGVTP